MHGSWSTASYGFQPISHQFACWPTPRAIIWVAQIWCLPHTQQPARSHRQNQFKQYYSPQNWQKPITDFPLPKNPTHRLYRLSHSMGGVTSQPFPAFIQDNNAKNYPKLKWPSKHITTQREGQGKCWTLPSPEHCSFNIKLLFDVAKPCWTCLWTHSTSSIMLYLSNQPPIQTVLSGSGRFGGGPKHSHMQAKSEARKQKIGGKDP